MSVHGYEQGAVSALRRALHFRQAPDPPTLQGLVARGQVVGTNLVECRARP